MSNLKVTRFFAAAADLSSSNYKYSHKIDLYDSNQLAKRQPEDPNLWNVGAQLVTLRINSQDPVSKDLPQLAPEDLNYSPLIDNEYVTVEVDDIGTAAPAKKKCDIKIKPNKPKPAGSAPPKIDSVDFNIQSGSSSVYDLTISLENALIASASTSVSGRNVHIDIVTAKTGSTSTLIPNIDFSGMTSSDYAIIRIDGSKGDAYFRFE